MSDLYYFEETLSEVFSECCHDIEQLVAEKICQLTGATEVYVCLENSELNSFELIENGTSTTHELLLNTINKEDGSVELVLTSSTGGLAEVENEKITLTLAGDEKRNFDNMMRIGATYDCYLHLGTVPTPEINGEYKSFRTPAAPIKTL